MTLASAPPAHLRVGPAPGIHQKMLVSGLVVEEAEAVVVVEVRVVEVMVVVEVVVEEEEVVEVVD